jgi:type I restriction enzyme M protein
MALKKSEIYSKLWASCDELRGGMDASQYKDYVLVLLFVKYVSDKYAGKTDAVIDIPKGGKFADLIALKGNKDIGDKINIAISKLAEANDLKGVIDVADFNDEAKLGKGKDMVDRLSNLVGIFETLDFSGNRADGDDLLGDAYEYLMRNFATESGKSKGQFYTPAEVSQIMAKVIGVSKAKSTSQTIYDPTCGSGSLLLKAHDEAAVDLTIYGQEMDNATMALAKMNMYLHGCPSADIRRDNTLSTPNFKDNKGLLKTFDFIVSNPPFSVKTWTSGFDPANDLFRRFEYGIPPAKKGDYAFLLHVLASLKSTGKGAIILPHGVLFRGDAEGGIRREIVRRGFVKGIIGLPANLFYGTGIPACIIVLDKEGADSREGIFMIDASKGFMKDGNKNRLRSQDIHKIVDAFNKQTEIPKYSRLVALSEIGDPKNDFNLNIPRYIDSTEPEDLQDIAGHLQGGIPNSDLENLAAYWQVFPKLKSFLFGDGPRKDSWTPKIAQRDIKNSIIGHDEFSGYKTSVLKRYEKWLKATRPRLEAIKKGDKPKTLIHTISDSLLEEFNGTPLIDHYDAYQHLMDYWVGVMQDDVYMIATDGWIEAAKPKLIIEQKDKKSKDKPDFTVGKQKFKAELIPPHLIIIKFFVKEQVSIDQLQTEISSLEQQQEELKEEYGGDDGLLNDVIDNDKIKKGDVAARLKQIKGDKDSADEAKLLQQWIDWHDQATELGRKKKELEKSLENKIIAQYGNLTDDVVKAIVVNDKWIASIESSIQGELDRVTQTLSGRIKTLAERYETPLPDLLKKVELLSVKVGEHLKKMGFA